MTHAITARKKEGKGREGGREGRVKERKEGRKGKRTKGDSSSMCSLPPAGLYVIQ